jgi:hypothetical protein
MRQYIDRLRTSDTLIIEWGIPHLKSLDISRTAEVAEKSAGHRTRQCSLSTLFESHATSEVCLPQWVTFVTALCSSVYTFKLNLLWSTICRSLRSLIYSILDMGDKVFIFMQSPSHPNTAERAWRGWTLFLVVSSKLVVVHP